jgi:hypothetical protein
MSSSGERHAIIGRLQMNEEVIYEKYELRGGSSSFPDTELIQEVEAANIQDLKSYVAENYQGHMIWVVNKSRSTNPFMLIPMRLGPPIVPMSGR